MTVRDCITRGVHQFEELTPEEQRQGIWLLLHVVHQMGECLAAEWDATPVDVRSFFEGEALREWAGDVEGW